MTTSSSVDRHNLKFSSSESAHNIVGAGSISHDSLTFCNICSTNGFPHEAIRFVKVVEVEEILSFDGIVCKVVRRPSISSIIISKEEGITTNTEAAVAATVNRGR